MLPLRRLGGRGVLRASGGYTVRRRGGQRGPVALRPRLSPGVPLSWDGATDLRCGTWTVKSGPLPQPFTARIDPRQMESHSPRMRGRHLHEGGFFRPCSRCGRRTFWLCEDCRRATCPECATVEIGRVGTSDRLHRMCPLPVRVPLPGPTRLAGWPVDGALATDRSGGPSLAFAH